MKIKIFRTIYSKAKSNNLITKATIEQYYDEKEKMFLSDRFIKGTCPKCVQMIKMVIAAMNVAHHMKYKT